MSWLHGRCTEVETLFKARLVDLEQENAGLRAQVVEIVSAAAARERELVDRVIALTNPGAHRAIVQSSAPAAPLPTIQRAPGLSAVRRVVPGTQRRPSNRTNVAPALTPPGLVASQAAMAEALADEQPQPE